MHSNHFLEEITIARAHFSERQVPEPICILCIVHYHLHALSPEGISRSVSDVRTVALPAVGSQGLDETHSRTWTGRSCLPWRGTAAGRAGQPHAARTWAAVRQGRTTRNLVAECGEASLHGFPLRQQALAAQLHEVRGSCE